MQYIAGMQTYYSLELFFVFIFFMKYVLLKYVLLKFAGVNVLEQYWLVLYWLVRINSIYSPITNHYHCNSLLVVSVPALGTSTSKTSPLDGRLRSELTGMIWSYGILEFLEVLAPKKNAA